MAISVQLVTAPGQNNNFKLHMADILTHFKSVESSTILYLVDIHRVLMIKI